MEMRCLLGEADVGMGMGLDGWGWSGSGSGGWWGGLGGRGYCSWFGGWGVHNSLGCLRLFTVDKMMVVVAKQFLLQNQFIYSILISDYPITGIPDLFDEITSNVPYFNECLDGLCLPHRIVPMK